MIKASTLLRISPKLAQSIGVTSEDGDTLVPNPLINFGYALKAADGSSTSALAWTNILNIIQESDGVRQLGAGSSGLLLNGESTDVTVALREFPALGTVTLIDMSDQGLM